MLETLRSTKFTIRPGKGGVGVSNDSDSDGDDDNGHDDKYLS